MLLVFFLDLDHFRDGRQRPPLVVDEGVLHLGLHASSRVIVGEIQACLHSGTTCVTRGLNSTQWEGTIDEFAREGGHIASMLTKTVFFFVYELRICLDCALWH